MLYIYHLLQLPLHTLQFKPTKGLIFSPLWADQVRVTIVIWIPKRTTNLQISWGVFQPLLPSLHWVRRSFNIWSFAVSWNFPHILCKPTKKILRMSRRRQGQRFAMEFCNWYCSVVNTKCEVRHLYSSIEYMYCMTLSVAASKVCFGFTMFRWHRQWYSC